MGKEKTELSSYLIDITPIVYPTVRCEEIVDRLNKRLREHLWHTAYDNIGMLFQRRQSTCSAFKVDSYAYYQQFSSGNCIGLTLGLIQNILNYCRNWDEIMRLPPLYVIPATLPPHYGRADDFGHVALLVLCSDGVILLDSGFHIPQAIVLKNREEVTVTVGEKIWRFQLEQEIKHEDKVHISGVIHASVETPLFGRESFKYLLRHISNPDGIILRTNMADARRVSYVRRDWDGVQTSHITICFGEQLIKMAALKNDSNLYYKAEIHFSECKDDILDIYLSLFGCPSNLMKQIKYLVNSDIDEHERCSIS
ncbi:hypothetical protein Lgra_3386 [Legionella gratiana]|uniref:Uncharacterized protein n=1 Tax=Legionella gratiana TaxID=45066 RepID=A0A378JEJ1_9GAMM|nr:hypothetical protein [Legionella gratiana]KTD05509.1 hypothetical protein Lgra_3386 [Legionella gratiana]STX45411.1 Uncharacterised protein [Legionella gratiana]